MPSFTQKHTTSQAGEEKNKYTQPLKKKQASKIKVNCTNPKVQAIEHNLITDVVPVPTDKSQITKVNLSSGDQFDLGGNKKTSHAHTTNGMKETTALTSLARTPTTPTWSEVPLRMLLKVLMFIVKD